MSSLASTSRAQMRYIRESVFGTTPSAGNGVNLRMTGESLDFNQTKETSKEIRSDRQLSGAVTVDASAGGDINIHFQYNEYDPFLETALLSAYTVYGTLGETAVSFSAAYTATTITASVAPTGNDAFTLLQLGQWFQVSHAANANDKKLLRVSTSVAPTTTVITLDASTPANVVTSAAGAKLRSSRLTNGVTETFYTLEKQQSDIGQFIAYKGQYVSKMGLKFAAGALTDGSFSFMGKNAVRSATTILPGTMVASKTYDIQNGVTGVGVIWEAGVPSTTRIKSMDFSIDNNMRNQTGIGTLGPLGIGVGDFAVTGNLSVYFETASLYDKFLSDTYTAITVGCQDVAGNGYVFTFPRVMLMSVKITNGAKNTDVMADFTWTAFADDLNATAALRKTLFIDRVGASV
jgi:hypothetical protein